jgi:rhodanese-related sulfurtransferase
MTHAMRKPSHAFALEYPPGNAADAQLFFASKLAFEIDHADLEVDLERGTARIVLLDARTAHDYERCHIPGSISLPHRSITPQTTAAFSRDALLVTYCWGPHCNAATKAALKLSALGFPVKEMIGGLVAWRQDGLPVEGTLGEAAPLYG